MTKRNRLRRYKAGCLMATLFALLTVPPYIEGYYITSVLCGLVSIAIALQMLRDMHRISKEDAS